MGHGHQPSVPTPEAQETGEAEHQLDFPSFHASQMSTSRVRNIFNQVSVAPMCLTKHFHDFIVYILCWSCMTSANRNGYARYILQLSFYLVKLIE